MSTRKIPFILMRNFGTKLPSLAKLGVSDQGAPHSGDTMDVSRLFKNDKEIKISEGHLKWIINNLPINPNASHEQHEKQKDYLRRHLLPQETDKADESDKNLIKV